MKDSEWFKNLEIQVMNQKDQLYKRDFAFFHVDTFLKISKKIDEFSAQCSFCQNLKPEAEEFAKSLSLSLKGNVSSRKEYEKKLLLMENHLKTSHQVFHNEYFTSLFSLIGIIGGILLGGLISVVIIPTFIKHGMLIGSVAGLITGRIAGRNKDKNIKKRKRMLE
jgi:hypothetical protein